MTIYPLHALRIVALWTQGLCTGNGTGLQPTRETIYEIVNKIGCVQIDTISVVRRSQYLVPWSRLGSYEPSDLDALQSSADRRLFEGWQHATCIIPLTEYRYQMPHQRNLREHPTTWYQRWLTDHGLSETIEMVRQRIQRDGALKVSDFEHGDHPSGAWWNWRPAKVALEFLYVLGDLMVAGREKFQRVYDLTERVLPRWVDTREPTPEERDRFWVERGAKALGVCTARQAGDYTWMKVSRSKPHTESLVKNGILIPIQGQLANGNIADLLIHRDNLPLLEQAAEGVLRTPRTTFLSPFDSLWWAARRDEMLWGFRQSLECYLPASKRIFGYFCLPILHKDRLVGRLDPKLEREAGKLCIKAIYLEPGVDPNAELVAAVATALRDFMKFHDAKELVIKRSQPEEFGRKLLSNIC